MAYRKRKQYNKKYTSRRGGRRRYNNNGNFTYGNVLDKVVKDVIRLKGLINTEFKTNDVSSTVAVPETGLVLLLNATIAGDDFDNRDGRQVRWKSIQYAINILQHATATQTITRVMIVIDKQPNATLMTIGELLTSGANNLDFRNLDNRKRFVILSDRVVTQSDTNNLVNRLDFYQKMDMITIYDDSNAGTIADIESNALFLVAVSSEATNSPTLQIETRMRFIDN